MPEPTSTAFVIVCSAVMALASLGAAMMPEKQSSAILASAPAEATTIVNINTSVMDDNRLRLVCVAGAIAGALLSWSITKKEDHRISVRKILASSISGIIFTPWIMRWQGWELSTDGLLACSGGVALMSWGILKILVPLATGIFETWFATKFKLPTGDDK
jgi:hypothetical protein